MSETFTEDELRSGLKKRYGWSDDFTTSFLAEVKKSREPEYQHGGWYIDANGDAYEYDAGFNQWSMFGVSLFALFDEPARPLTRLVPERR